MAFYKTEAVVLREYDLGEQDKIVVFYTRKYGRIRVVAKGARKIKSRFAPGIQLPCYDEIIVHKGRENSLDILSECKIKCPFIKIRSSLVKFACSSYLAELITRFVEDEQSCPVLFHLLLRSLFLIEETPPGQNSNLLIRSFELKLLDISGYRPCMERCVNCEKEVKLIKFAYFSAMLSSSFKAGGSSSVESQAWFGKETGSPLEGFYFSFSRWKDAHTSLYSEFRELGVQVQDLIRMQKWKKNQKLSK